MTYYVSWFSWDYEWEESEFDDLTKARKTFDRKIWNEDIAIVELAMKTETGERVIEARAKDRNPNLGTFPKAPYTVTSCQWDRGTNDKSFDNFEDALLYFEGLEGQAYVDLTGHLSPWTPLFIIRAKAAGTKE